MVKKSKAERIVDLEQELVFAERRAEMLQQAAIDERSTTTACLAAADQRSRWMNGELAKTQKRVAELEKLGYVLDDTITEYRPALSKRGTLVVSLIGGPGTGKSTLGALLFAYLKMYGVNCEFLSEHAKELVWWQHWSSINHQPLVTATQVYRLDQLIGKVDVVVMDTCLLFGLVYSTDSYVDSFRTWVIDTFKQYEGLNIFLHRNEGLPYKAEGRRQDRESSKGKDLELLELVRELGVPCEEYSILEGSAVAEVVFQRILQRIPKKEVVSADERAG